MTLWVTYGDDKAPAEVEYITESLGKRPPGVLNMLHACMGWSSPVLTDTSGPRTGNIGGRQAVGGGLWK